MVGSWVLFSERLIHTVGSSHFFLPYWGTYDFLGAPALAGVEKSSVTLSQKIEPV
jgi:hypothetical protein